MSKLSGYRVILLAAMLIASAVHIIASPPPKDLEIPAAVGTMGSQRARTKIVTPPAGRDALYRSALLQPWDFPSEIADNPAREWDYTVNNPRHYSIMGPPDFWTPNGLRKQYEATKHLRFAPELFPTPPPFEVWVKEQQMIRMIKIHEDTIKQQLLHRGEQWTVQDALAWEMNRAEQLIILRQLQISIALKYATLDSVVREHELRMYRFWAGFLQNFRYMNIQYFDTEGFIEQLEHSVPVLQAKLDQYLRLGGKRTDPAYRELWDVHVEAQNNLIALRQEGVSAEHAAEHEEYAERARNSLAGTSIVREEHDLMNDARSIGKVFTGLPGANLVHFKPPTI